MEQPTLANNTNSQTQEIQLHIINDPGLAKQILGIRPTTQMPTRLKPDMIVCLIDQQVEEKIEGTFLLFQTLKPGIQPLNWRSPYQHGVVIDKGKVLFSHCKNQHGCDCVADVLREHFRDEGLDLTPENICDEDGRVVAIKLTKSRRRPRHRYH